MRTTLDLDDRLLAQARKAAAQRGTTLTAVVEEALTSALASRQRPPEPAFRLSWQPHAGRYIGGVDLADREALLEAMDQRR